MRDFFCGVCFDRCGCFKEFKEMDHGERRFSCKEEGLRGLVEEVCEKGHRVCVIIRDTKCSRLRLEGDREECGFEKKHIQKHGNCDCKKKYGGKHEDCECEEHDGQHKDCK